MNFIIHHPGKAGEVFLGLPMAKLLKESHPGCHVTWVVLDLYRDSVGHYPYIDRVVTIPTRFCNSLSDVNSHMSKHRFYTCRSQRIVRDEQGTHIDGYYGYIMHRSEDNWITLARKPFYTQIFENAVHLCPGADPVASWTPPEWYPTEQAVRDGEEFEKRYGGGPVVFFSPYIADQSCQQDNQSNFSMELIYGELKKWNLPLVCTGTKWDVKDFPSWAIDGYADQLSLGGLFYLIKNRAALVVTPNSGIGFAAHWLGAPTLMIDNRTGWAAQVQIYRKNNSRLIDDAQPGEERWPMFMKEYFYPQHLLPVPFEQIAWSPEAFLSAMERIRNAAG